VVIRSASAAVAATACALLLTTAPAHAELSQRELHAVTDEYLFGVPLPEFTEIRAERPHADQLDWDSDGCSLSPDEPLGYSFLESCHRHDFGYRNYQRQERFTEDNRLRIDVQFRTDMRSTCGTDRLCQATAEVYYLAVREFGGIASSTAEAIDNAQIRPVRDESGRLLEYRARTAGGAETAVPVEP